jgi:hypothetical protein
MKNKKNIANCCYFTVDIDYKLLLNPETTYETFSLAQQTGCSAPVLNRLLKSLPEKIQRCIKLSRSVSFFY